MQHTPHHAEPQKKVVTRVYKRKKKTADSRDHVYHGHLTFGAAAIPASVNLTAHCSPVKDQGQLGSCTANATAGALEYEENIQTGTNVAQALSRLFLYYNERDLEGDVDQDAGGEIRDVVKVAAKFGAPLESTWPYSDDTEHFKVKPTVESYAEGLNHKALQYQAVPQTLEAFQHVLAVFNRPIIVGIQIFDAFESDEVARTGFVPMPTQYENCLGGHAVLVVGYDNAKQCFLVRNSWGDQWGDPANPGCFWLPYQYMLNPELADDFWVILSDL
jgi:C1A family cysteine protease